MCSCCRRYGRRRWRISRQRDLRRVAGLPLQILAEFPAHGGIRAGAGRHALPAARCRARGHRRRRVHHVFDRISRADPPGTARTLPVGLCCACRRRRAVTRIAVCARRGIPGRCPPRWLRACMPYSARSAQGARTARAFCWPTCPSPRRRSSSIDPRRPLRSQPFAERARKHGVALDRRTRFLYSSGSVGINGECSTLEQSLRGPLQQLSDRRALPPAELSDAVLRHLHPWYLAGWLHLAGVGEQR